jgi:hypothetical protein
VDKIEEPTYVNLVSFLLLQPEFSLNRRLTSSPDNSDGVMEKNDYHVDLINDGKKLELKPTSQGSGLWIPYVETRAVIGYMSGSEKWIASGPFSGCQFSIGKRITDNKIFATHIAMQSGSQALEHYHEYRNQHNLSEWYWNKIPLPDFSAYSCSYIFVYCNAIQITSMVRLDVHVKLMGGSDGQIYNVHKFK